jgi:hypothetical protein
MSENEPTVEVADAPAAAGTSAEADGPPRAARPAAVAGAPEAPAGAEVGAPAGAPAVADAGAPAEAPAAAEVPAVADAGAPVVPAAGRRALLRPRNLVLLGVAVVALILAAIFGPLAWQLWTEKDVRIATPQRVAGLVLDDSQGAHDTVDYMRTAVETGVSLQHTVGAVYADEAGEPRSVLFVGGTGVLVEPSAALDKTFSLITDDAGGVESVQEVPAGPLGGVMKCGTTKTDGNPMAVCGWADHGSLGIAMFPNRPTDQSAELLRSMRKAMQNRG